MVRELTCSSANHVELGYVSVIFLTDDGNRDVVLVFIMTYGLLQNWQVTFGTAASL